jgi:hypothetical protein
MERHGRTGATGPRGPKGVRGATGASGRRGETGKGGHKGARGPDGSLQKRDVLDTVVTHFDDVYQQLNAQMKRVVQMQRQVDLMGATLGRLVTDTATLLAAYGAPKR